MYFDKNILDASEFVKLQGQNHVMRDQKMLQWKPIGILLETKERERKNCDQNHWIGHVLNK